MTAKINGENFSDVLERVAKHNNFGVGEEPGYDPNNVNVNHFDDEDLDLLVKACGKDPQAPFLNIARKIHHYRTGQRLPNRKPSKSAANNPIGANLLLSGKEIEALELVIAAKLKIYARAFAFNACFRNKQEEAQAMTLFKVWGRLQGLPNMSLR